MGRAPYLAFPLYSAGFRRILCHHGNSHRHFLAAFGLGGQELWLILIIVLVLFGGAKLPALARGLGQSIKEFKKASKDEDDEAGSQDRSRQYAGAQIARKKSERASRRFTRTAVRIEAN